MANLYIVEYSGVGDSHGSAVQAPKGFVQSQAVAIASGNTAASTVALASNTSVIRLKNEDTVTCYYRIGKAGVTATTADRPLLSGEVEDIYAADDIKAGASVIAVIKA